MAGIPSGGAVQRLEFHSEAFRALLQSPAVIAALEERGQRIAAAAGDGFGVRVSVGRNRARVVVMAESREAKIAEAEHKALTSAIGAGRG